MPRQAAKNTKKNYTSAVGRRREAVARVRLYSGSSVEAFGNVWKKGDIVINGKPIQEYFAFKGYTSLYKKLLNAAEGSDAYIFTVRVTGGGPAGQLDGVVHGIARALDKMNPEKYHSILRDNGYLTRDPRVRERRKVGTGGKARRKKQSPKR